jgi:hypothetical protein
VRTTLRVVIDVEVVVQLALAQQGDRYVANAQNDPSNPNPSEFDCSELVRWSCARAGVQPPMPDGSWIQQRWCVSQGTLVTVDRAIATRGALLFNHRDAGGQAVDPGPVCPPHAHVAVSLGDGTTIEAMGTKYGVLVASARNRSWTAGGLIPGCTYSSAPTPPPSPPPAPPPPGGPTQRLDKPVLERGSQGPAVAEMQQLLIKLGIGRLAQFGATGNFLDVTDEAVRLFQDQVRRQHDASMAVDGQCGPVTWGWLFYLAG